MQFFQGYINNTEMNEMKWVRSLNFSDLRVTRSNWYLIIVGSIKLKYSLSKYFNTRCFNTNRYFNNNRFLNSMSLGE